MPGFDGTGPAGKGPMTGRAMGRCATGGGMGAGGGRGLGRGMGGGGRRGMRGAAWESMPTQVSADEVHNQTMLNRIQELEEEIRLLRQEKGAAKPSAKPAE